MPTAPPCCTVTDEGGQAQLKGPLDPTTACQATHLASLQMVGEKKSKGPVPFHFGRLRDGGNEGEPLGFCRTNVFFLDDHWRYVPCNEIAKGGDLRPGMKVIALGPLGVERGC